MHMIEIAEQGLVWCPADDALPKIREQGVILDIAGNIQSKNFRISEVTITLNKYCS